MSEQDSGTSGMEESKAPDTPQPEQPPPTLSPLQELPFAQSVFVGPEGLRAGWRLLMYYLLFRGLARGGGFLLDWWSPKVGSRLWNYVLVEAAVLLAALLAALVMSRIERRRFGEYGLPGRGAFGRLFWVGALWGLAAISLLLVAMRGVHAFEFGHLVLHGLRLIKFAVFWAGFFLLIAFYEEFYFRGYFQFTLTQGLKFLEESWGREENKSSRTQGWSFWVAAAIFSGYFGSVHLGNSGEDWVGALGAGLIGLFFCLTLRRTGNLWFAIGFHSAFDWGETYLYSVPNSGTVFPGHLLSSSFHGPAWLTGGSVGPEGSVLAFVLIALLWVAFDRVYPGISPLAGEGAHPTRPD
jgi:membrane protease YdiL (CAAX protease family)